MEKQAITTVSISIVGSNSKEEADYCFRKTDSDSSGSISVN